MRPEPNEHRFDCRPVNLAIGAQGHGIHRVEKRRNQRSRKVFAEGPGKLDHIHCRMIGDHDGSQLISLCGIAQGQHRRPPDTRLLQKGCFDLADREIGPILDPRVKHMNRLVASGVP